MLFAVQYVLGKIFKEIHKQISWLKFQERIKKNDMHEGECGTLTVKD